MDVDAASLLARNNGRTQYHSRWSGYADTTRDKIGHFHLAFLGDENTCGLMSVYAADAWASALGSAGDVHHKVTDRVPFSRITALRF